MRTFDYVVVGSGIAGLTFALKAAEKGSVAIVTKKKKGDSSTARAQGGIACVTSSEDTIEDHLRDTLIAGAGLCHEEVVRTVLAEGPECVHELIERGMQFDQRRNQHGASELDLTKEGGHSKRRILHARDMTGAQIEKTLLEAIARHPQITLLEHHMAVDLVTTQKLHQHAEQETNRCVGLYVLHEEKGTIEVLCTDVTVLATGGCGKVYLYTSNPDIATGDGVAMAWRAGVPIANMEFMQFHPTCLFHPRAKSFLISEALRGEGGVLRNSAQERFMQHYDERQELAPRDIVARAIDTEMKKRGDQCVFLDMTHKLPTFIRERFPKIYETCLSYGIDITKEPIPVVPAAHYQCGGIQTDLNGATTLAGLYAIGETACTGLHGANRLASNSLLEGLVMARRAESDATEYRTNPLPEVMLAEWHSGGVPDLEERIAIAHNWDEIRRLMWDYMGIVRTDERLERATRRLKNLEQEIEGFYWNFKVTVDLLELRNLVTIASLMIQSAKKRKESRGLHYTLDYPERNDDEFLRDTVLVQEKVD